MVAAVQTQVRFNVLMLPWLVLLTVGTVMVGSAAVALGGDYLTRHLVFLSIALVVAGGVFAVPSAVWNKLYLLGWLAALAVAIAVLVPGVGHEVNGASRWIRFGGFSIQAAEIAKFGLCVYLAGYLQRHQAEIGHARALILPLLMVLTVVALLVLEPDLGSAVVITVAAVGLLFLAGAKLRYFLGFAVIGVGALALLIAYAPYRIARVVAFLDPWAVAYGSGYQLTQALIAFGRGEVFGLGLGEGIQKLFYLPEAHNDFIFAVIAEELGGVGAIALAVLLAYLVVKIFTVARWQLQLGNYFQGYVAYFVGLIIGLQLLVNLGVNTGVLPTKGLTLPFVSYGGNSLIISCAMFALVLRGVIDAKADQS